MAERVATRLEENGNAAQQPAEADGAQEVGGVLEVECEGRSLAGAFGRCGSTIGWITARYEGVTLRRLRRWALVGALVVAAAEVGWFD